MGLLFLAIFDVVVGLYPIFLFIGSQGFLLFYGLLGLLYIISGWKFMSSKERWRKIFLIAVIPLSILATFNFLELSRETPPYRYALGKGELLIVGFTVLLPLLLNLAILTRPKVKEQFK